MKWYWFQLLALIRGLFYKWPKAPWIPQGYTGVHCALRSWRESRDMWAMGWIPYVVHRTTTDGSIARMFIIVDDQPQPAPPDFGPDDERGEEEFEEMEAKRHNQPVLGCDCFDCIR